MKEQQKKHLIEMMEQDEKLGLYDMKNIHVLPTGKPSRILFDFDENDYLPIQEEDVRMENQHLVQNRNIYITSDEEIKPNDYITDGYIVWKWKDDSSLLGRKKIILTTDDQLIKDGIQAIDDEFLKWFVDNTSCEFVEVKSERRSFKEINWITVYKIIIPKEETEHLLSTEANKERLKEDIKQYPLTPDECYKQKTFEENFIDCIGKSKVVYEPKQETLEEAKFTAYKKYWNDLHTQLVKSNFLNGFEEGAKWQEQQQDKFAIEFAEWLVTRELGVDSFKLNDGILEIFKEKTVQDYYNQMDKEVHFNRGNFNK